MADGSSFLWAGDWVFLWEWLWPDRFREPISILQLPWDWPQQECSPGAVLSLLLQHRWLGAAAGAFTVWLFYRHHFNRTEDPGAQLACFSTAPAIRKPVNNFISELIGTFVLIFVILYIAEPSINWTVK